MSNVKAIGKQGITPRVVLETLRDEIDELQDVYVVGFPREEGHTVYASGDLAKMALAALILQELSLYHIHGQVDDE